MNPMNYALRLTLVFLAVTFVCFVNGEYEYTCDVGENNEKVLGNGLCNAGGNGGDGNAKCNDHCQKQFGAEFVGSECRTVKGSSKPECICKLKCSVGGCWGDPHCYSFDGTHFGYQGIPEHYLVKPKQGVQFPSLPYFTVSETNRYLTGSETLGVLDVLNLLVWNQKIQIVAPPADGWKPCTLKVNGESKSIPYRYSEVKQGYKENYIDVQYGGVANSELVLKTSFGVVIVVIVYPYGYSNYADVAVHVARHPELMGNVCGLFGNFNDNPSDDNIDSKGNPQPLDFFSWDFGDSWCVSDSGKTSKSGREKIAKDYQDHIKNVKNDKGKHEHLQKHCNQLGDPEFVKCGKKQRRVIPSPEDCYTDLSYLKNEKDQESAACELVKGQNKLCGCNVECATR